MTDKEAADTEVEGESGSEIYQLRLYIADNKSKSATALTNLKRICEEYLPGKYKIEVIDLVKNPQLARSDQILAIPTLMRMLPQPVRRVIGDLSSVERVLIGIDVINESDK